jgi:Ca2+-binding RTX toxin-like protein
LASVSGVHGHHVKVATSDPTSGPASVPARSHVEVFYKDTGIGAGPGSATTSGSAGDTLLGSAGYATIVGAPTDTVAGTTGNAFIDARHGQSVLGGSAGKETIWGGAGDTINGATGANVTIDGVAGDTVIGGTGNEFIDADRGNQWILGGRGSTTVWGGIGDSVQGAAAGGSATIDLGAGRVSGQQEILWDNGTSSGGNDTVVDFSQSVGDRISLNAATDNPNAVLASATQDNGGNAVLHLNDGSSITLIGVSLSRLTTSYFTTH